MKDTKIGIIGHGFVGKALSGGFKHFGYKHIFLHDVAYGTKLEDLLETEVCFICVPTPMDSDGSMSDDIIVDVLSKLEVLDYQGVITIKSTVTPPVVHKLIKDFSALRIVTNPEFLTERCAFDDFINTEWAFIGSNNGDGQIVYDLHADMFPDAVIKVVSPEAAMMIKYMSNVWFSVKVSLMNEFYDLWNELGYGNWDQIPDAFQHDARVGKTHLQVPGHDGSRGFGGKCVGGDEIMFLQDGNGNTIMKYFKDLMKSGTDGFKIASVNKENFDVEFKEMEGIRSRVVDRTISIKTDKGLRLKTSVDHGHLVYNDGQLVRKEAQELNVGDLLLSFKVPELVRNLDEYFEIDLLDYEKVKWVKLDYELNEDQIKELYNNKVITRDQKQRLTHGDKRIVSKDIYKYFDIKPLKNQFVKVNSSSEYKRFVEINEDWAKLIGYYLAEGFVTHEENGKCRIGFCFGFHEEEYIKETEEILDRLGFSYHNRIDKYKGHDSVNIVIVKNSILAYVLEVLECGCGNKSKKIPYQIFNNLELTRLCVSRYFRGDGSAKNGSGKYIGFNTASSSKILTEQLNSVFRYLDAIPSYTQKTNKKSSCVSHQLNISRKEDINILVDYLDLVENERNMISEKLSDINNGGCGYKNYIEMDGYILVRVVDIKINDEPEEVYSIQVLDNEDFLTSGGLLTANCFPKDLNALMAVARQLGTQHDVMKAAWSDNKVFRKEKDWLDIAGAVTKSYKESS